MIDHVGLEIRRADAEACVALWALLGWHEVLPPDALLDVGAWVQRGGQTIHLLFVEEPVVPAEGHTAVVCPDFDETVARLRAAGHEVLDRRRYWGSPRAFVRDPAGHRIELMQFGPGQLPPGVNR